MELVDNATPQCRLDRSLLIRQHNINNNNSIDNDNRFRSCCLFIQLQFSYLLGLFSSTVIAFSLIQLLHNFHQQWLVLIIIGIIFILIGATIYRNGVMIEIKHHPERFLTNNRRRQSSRNKLKRCNKRSARESHIFESHLSINMLPQCFTNLDITSSSLLLNNNNRNNNSRQLALLSITNSQPINSETIVDIHHNHSDQQNQNQHQNQQQQQQTETDNTSTINNQFDSNTDLMINNELESTITDRIENNNSSSSLSSINNNNNDNRFNLNDVINNIENEEPPKYEDVIDNDIYRTL